MFEVVGEIEGGVRVLRHASLVVSLHPRPSNTQDLTCIHRICRRVVGEHPQMSSITILLQAGMELDGPTRDAAKALASDFRETSIGQAIVFGGHGLHASVVRSILTGVNLVAGARAPQRVFKSTEEGVRWVCALPQQDPQLRDADRVWSALVRADAAVRIG